MALRDIQAELTRVLNGMAEINSVPDMPTDRVPEFPFAVCQPDTGLYSSTGSLGFSLKDEQHTLLVFILVQREQGSLEDRVDESIDYVDLFITRLREQMNDDQLGGTVVGIPSVEYSYDTVNWAGINCLGYTLRVNVIRTDC